MTAQDVYQRVKEAATADFDRDAMAAFERYQVAVQPYVDALQGAKVEAFKGYERAMVAAWRAYRRIERAARARCSEETIAAAAERRYHRDAGLAA